MTPGDAAVLFRLLGQVRKGAWTNDPADPTYDGHWNHIPMQDGEQLRAVYPGNVVPSSRPVPGLSNMVNVRVTDQNVYMDTPSVAAIGPLASAAKLALNRSGLGTPRSYPVSEVNIVPIPDQHRVQVNVPGYQVTGRTDQHVGRPADLSAKDQLRNLRRMLGR